MAARNVSQSNSSPPPLRLAQTRLHVVLSFSSAAFVDRGPPERAVHCARKSCLRAKRRKPRVTHATSGQELPADLSQRPPSARAHPDRPVEPQRQVRAHCRKLPALHARRSGMNLDGLLPAEQYQLVVLCPAPPAGDPLASPGPSPEHPGFDGQQHRRLRQCHRLHEQKQVLTDTRAAHSRRDLTPCDCHPGVVRVNEPRLAVHVLDTREVVGSRDMSRLLRTADQAFAQVLALAELEQAEQHPERFGHAHMGKDRADVPGLPTGG